MQALSNCLEAATQSAAASDNEDGITGLVQRWMFPLVKKGLLASNLAVRQVCLPFHAHAKSASKVPGHLCSVQLAQ